MRGVYLLMGATLLFGYYIQGGQSTCVLESDFGFIINCAFKKSGLFRIRNLGGVKAHIGWGISLGDELGFKESISNTEMNRRRSAEVSKMQAQLIQATQKQQEQKKAKFVDTDKVSSQESTAKRQIVPAVAAGTLTKKQDEALSAIPPFKPIPPAAERPFVSKVSIDPQTSKVMAVIAVPKKKITNSISDRIVSTSSDEENLLLPQQQQQTSNTLKNFLSSNNITQEVLEMALLQRQQVAAKKSASTTTSTTTLRPVTSKHKNSIGKVMNAPKEYYPVGYDKNFDDNFAARVDLPETSFYCGDQKHFPGLYADEDLGCMVFHVCALTDDGLIMKSFLCPESTLFDQAILKCNWWFYVDCKNSKKLYDSNIPISKSYQLMKALTFFSAYKKEPAVNGTSSSKKDSSEDKN